MQFRLCQQSQRYRDHWDRQVSLLPENEREDRPADKPYVKRAARRVGIGTLLKRGLAAIGVKPCRGCGRRADTLDRLASIPIGTKVDTAFHYVDVELPDGYDAPDLNWAVGITTAPRAKPAIVQTYLSVLRAGFTDVRIFAEPGSTVPKTKGVVENPKRRGVVQNWLSGLRMLRAEKPNARGYLLIQDDLVFCRNIRAFLDADLWFSDKIGFVSPYRSSGKQIQVGKSGKRQFRPSDMYIDVTEGHRQRCKPGNGLWGGCTMALPPWSVDILLNDRQLSVRDRMLDLAIHPILHRHGLEAWYYNPSLVNTISGLPSSLGHGTGGPGMNANDTFVGVEFDAMELATCV